MVDCRVIVRSRDDEALALRLLRTSELDEATRAAVIGVCVDAHREPDLQNLFAYLPPDGLHVLASLGLHLVGHAVVTTRWLQPQGLPVLRTAYVDAVAVSPSHHGRGVGSAVMRQLASAVGDYDRVMILRLPSTPALDRDTQLTIEAHATRIW